MILYHGSTMEVSQPHILKSEIGRDFGFAFYTTDIQAQTERWARRRAMIESRRTKNERVFADAKEKHAMRYTHHRGLAAVTRWVRLKFAAMNLKKLAIWSWNDSGFPFIFSIFLQSATKTYAFPA